jgi:hypothetical protein
MVSDVHLVPFYLVPRIMDRYVYGMYETAYVVPIRYVIFPM